MLLSLVGCAGSGTRAVSASTLVADEEALLQRVRSRESWILFTCEDVTIVHVGTHEEQMGADDASPLPVRDYIMEGCDFAEDATCDDVNGCITDSMRREHVVQRSPPASPTSVE